MGNLDIRTLMFSFFLTALVGAFVLVLLWYQNRHRFKGTIFWILDYSFQTIGLMLISLRGVVPDWMSILLANSLSITGIFMGYLGIARFLHKKPHLPLNILLILAFIFVHYWYSERVDILAVRNGNIAAASMILFFQCAWFARARLPKEEARITLFTTIILALLGAVNLVRLIHILTGDTGPNDFLQSAAFDQRILVLYLILLNLLTFSLALMFNGFLNLQLARKKEKLQELNATKDKLFSIIAHDLKSPFNSILGFSSLLKEKEGCMKEARTDNYGTRINESAHRALDLLQNLLEWSQSQTGHLRMNPENLDMRELIRETINFFTDASVHKSITLDNRLPAGVIVQADKAMTATIMRNLISNALKFSFTGGTITLSAWEKNDSWEILVKDHGTGIAAEEIGKLFRIDRNCTRPGTANEKGTGLGLLLCQEFAEKQGGTLSVESIPGVGSTFSLTLPK